MYKYLLVIIFVLYVHYNTKVSASCSIGDNRYFRVRNSLLRIYIAYDITKPKQIIEKTKDQFTKHIYKKIETNYNKFVLFYNSLTDEEKELIDFIISLCY
uniref:Uncharacterized protein n=1 Tax=viral metagenome TaxID=1070528 RepID=A0A6C0DHW3_9ZZZZ